MDTKKHMRGYIRPMTRLSEVAQAAALSACNVVFTEGKSETLNDCIGTLRKGDVLAVVWLHVLAPPRTTYKDKPRDGLWDAIKRIEAKGAVIFEVETGRCTSNKSERDDMIRDAIEHITSAGRAASGRKNGRSSKGRPKIEPAETDMKLAKSVWFDLRHATNDHAVAVGPKRKTRGGMKPWPLTRYYRLFGASGRGN